jgi:hypothetical protein
MSRLRGENDQWEPTQAWTLSPETAIPHIRDMSPRERTQVLTSYRSMAQGTEGGQIEMWSFFTVRWCIYPHWTDDDFRSVLTAFDIPTVLS